MAFFPILALFATVPAAAQSDSRDGITESRLKAAYLYNFARYFTWPEEAFESDRSPFVIGVYGNGRLGAALDEVARRKTANGRRIVVHRFKSWDDYRPCQMVFLPSSAGKDAHDEASVRTRGAAMLLVGETPGFAVRGATINFYPDRDGTIGFEINVDDVARRKLEADARLLKLAKIVRTPRSSRDGS